MIRSEKAKVTYIDVFAKIDELIKSDSSIEIGRNDVCAFREYDGEFVLYVKKSEISNVLSQEFIEFLDANDLIDEFRESRLNGKAKVCVPIRYSALKQKATGSVYDKIKEGQLSKKLQVAKKEIEILSKDIATSDISSQILVEVKRAILDESEYKKSFSPFSISKDSNKTHAGSPILFLSDWHWAETVDPNQIENLNEYNIDIALKRSSRVFVKSLDLLFNHMSGQTYDKAVIALGGDMLSGNIHEELQRTNEMPIADAVKTLAIELARGIREYSKHFKEVYVPCVVGNHGRFDKKPTAKGKSKDNFDYMVYSFLEALLTNESNVKIDISDASDIRFNLYDTRYLLTHGDQIKGGAGIGGIWPSMMKTDQRKRKRHQLTGGGYDYLMVGHFHHYGMVDNIIVNGSLKGYDEWVYQMNFDYEPPTQALWITHPRHGITSSFPIFGE